MKISKWFAAAAVALMMTACGNPVEDAKAAYDEKDYVKAAECLTELSEEDVEKMSESEKMEVGVIALGIMASGDEEAIKILGDFDVKNK